MGEASRREEQRQEASRAGSLGQHIWRARQQAESRCMRCGLRTRATQPPGHGCAGIAKLVDKADPSHRLMVFEPVREASHPTVVACTLCHRSGSTAGQWDQPCSRRPTESRTDSIRRLGKGQAPHSRSGSAVHYQSGRPLTDCR